MLAFSALALAELGTSLGAAAPIAPGTRVLLVSLATALLLSMVVFAVYLHLTRRRARPPQPRPAQAPQPPAVPLAARRAAPAASSSRPAGGMAGGLAVAAASSRPTAGPVICPACRREFDSGVRYCPYDSRKLMPIAELRGPLWARHRPDPAPTGVMAKICPQCTGRYDLSTSFCVKDGTELMTIN
jgi:hypothetical protein